MILGDLINELEQREIGYKIEYLPMVAYNVTILVSPIFKRYVNFWVQNKIDLSTMRETVTTVSNVGKCYHIEGRVSLDNILNWSVSNRIVDIPSKMVEQ